MATIEYIARRSLATGHVLNTTYSVELDLQAASFSVKDEKESARSPGGGMETIFIRQDVFWTIRLAPVKGFSLELMREFLDSTESGETFRIWLWPEDTAPLPLKRLDDSHTEEAFMRGGSERSDYFHAEFTALQASPYDPAGAGAGAGGYPGGGSGGSGGEDAYAADDGGDGGSGGLDPPPYTPPEPNEVLILVGSHPVGFVGYDAGNNVEDFPENAVGAKLHDTFGGVQELTFCPVLDGGSYIQLSFTLADHSGYGFTSLNIEPSSGATGALNLTPGNAYDITLGYRGDVLCRIYIWKYPTNIGTEWVPGTTVRGSFSV